MTNSSDSLSILSLNQAQARLESRAREAKHTAQYAAMYSSWLGGITRDAAMMVIPVDDHGFHRGDAVFEAIKCIDAKIHALDPHLARLSRSAEMIGLTLPLSIQELRDIAIQTTRSSQLNSSLLRLYVSRGPGSFSPNPYESIGAQTYLVVTALSTPSEGQYENGVTAATSSIAVKEGFFATVKSCNYLPNVLMKKESVDRKLGFTVSVDERGFLAEGATENFAIVSHDNEFLVPNFNRTLRGITVTRLMELVHENLNQADCPITSVRHASITVEDVVRAREAMVIGTTLDCLPITRFNDQPIGINGKVGPAARWFRELLKRDFAHGVSV